MKIRSGFVSNSSSSSFVLLMKYEDVQTVRDTMPAYIQYIVDELLEEQNVFGTKVLVHTQWYDRDGGSNWDYFYNNGYEGDFPTVKHKRYSWHEEADEYIIDTPNEAWKYFYSKFQEHNFDEFEHEVEM